VKKDMTTGTEWKLILLFSLPIIAGNLLQQLYNVVDGIIVGNFVSEAAIAAVTTCLPLTMLFIALAHGLSIGGGVVISQYYGAGKKDELPLAINSALVLLGMCGIAIMLIGILFSEVMLRHILMVPEEIMPDAGTYLRIYSAGLFFQFMYNGIAATLRAFGDSRATLYFLLMATMLSTALTFLFILVFKWGVAGAAFSTVLAQFACATVSYTYLRKRFPREREGRHWDKKIITTMAKLGLPVALQMGVISLAIGAMQRLANSFVDTVPGIMAGYGAAVRLDFIVVVLGMGFQSGLANFVGQNIGAGRLDRVKRGYHVTLAMSLTLVIIVSAILFFFAEQAIGLFGLEDDALRIGVETLKFVMMFFWLFPIFATVGGVLQGAGDTVLLSKMTLAGLAVRVVTGYLGVHLDILGYQAAWATLPIQWALLVIFMNIRYLTGGWKKKAVAGKLSQEKK